MLQKETVSHELLERIIFLRKSEMFKDYIDIAYLLVNGIGLEKMFELYKTNMMRKIYLV